MNDDRMDELLASGTRDYNAPGAVPREEMWARIQASRAAAPRAATIARRPQSVWAWAGMAIAAGLILAAGIAIGRRIERPSLPAQNLAEKAPGAVRRDSLAGTGPMTSSPPAAIVASKQPPRDVDVLQFRTQSRNAARHTQELAQSAATARDNQSNDLLYRLVVLQHLAGSEAMITAFRSSARRGDVDREIAAWSRELLSTTRMLETSAAAQDPNMRRLLEDLDLVIAQITQYMTRGTNNPDDLDLIEQSISKRGVIAKLRGSNPGRTLPAGT